MAQDMNPRTCIVTKTERSPDELIRFVKGPDNQVFPDLKRKLPGRGVWVTARREILEQAVSKKLFARGFKDKVKVDENLPQLVESLLRQASLQALAMSKKAGLVVTGQAKAEAAIRDGIVLALLQASDAGTDGVKKLAAALKAQKIYEEQEVTLIDEFSSEELDKTLNGTNTMYVALSQGGATEKLVKMINRLINFKAPEA